MHGQVEATGDGRPGAGLEVVDAAEPMLLHDAVLVVPGCDQQEQRDGSPNVTHRRQSDNGDGADNQSLLEALPLLGHPIRTYPSGVVVWDRDPEVDRGDGDVGQPRLTAERDQDGSEGEGHEPDHVGGPAGDVARFENASPLRWGAQASRRGARARTLSPVLFFLLWAPQRSGQVTPLA